jgi:hypothetical protein
MRHVTSIRFPLAAVALALVCLAIDAAPALAQAPAQAQKRPAAAPPSGEPRVRAMINAGYQPSTTSFDDSFTFTLYQETGSTSVSYPVDAGGIFEGGAAIRLWKGLAVGGVISHFSGEGTATVNASLPHPFFLQRPRQVSGEAGGMSREENAVHIQAQYLLPPFGRLSVVLAGGPSIIDVKQTAVIHVNYSEEFPYDAASFTGVDTKRATGTATGFNAGVDFQWMFTRNVGVGGLVRITKATVDLDIDNRTIPVDAGGTQIAAGIRLAF